MALIKCRHCGQMISDKAERCPKCGKNNNIECELVDTTKNEIGNTHQEVITKKRSVNKVVVSLLILVAICVGGVCGYFLYPNISVNNEPTFYEIEATDSIVANEDLLKDGSYYWLYPTVFPIVYELKDGAIRNAYLNGYPLEAKISHGKYFKGKNDMTFPNGQKIDLYIQFDLNSGEGYIQQDGNRTNITMYKLCMPSDSVNNIIRSCKSNYENAMRDVQSDIVDEEETDAVACDTVVADYADGY